MTFLAPCPHSQGLGTQVEILEGEGHGVRWPTLAGTALVTLSLLRGFFPFSWGKSRNECSVLLQVCVKLKLKEFNTNL